jgi:hypothetical protein
LKFIFIITIKRRIDYFINEISDVIPEHARKDHDIEYLNNWHVCRIQNGKNVYSYSFRTSCDEYKFNNFFLMLKLSGGFCEILDARRVEKSHPLLGYITNINLCDESRWINLRTSDR